MIGILKKEQIENILHSQSICRLGCIDGKYPYVVPLTFYYDGEALICQSQEGKKLNLMRKNPNVCVQLDQVIEVNDWQSVMLLGTFEELKGEALETAKEKLYGSVFTLLTGSRTHKFEHADQKEVAYEERIKSVLFRIKIKEITGRYEKL
jgi:nitroimidazol reductase NimA-like FMN-containing flavoprotein (pyridoxamine 5'-phosphate oxidase superfamily)